MLRVGVLAVILLLSGSAFADDDDFDDDDDAGLQIDWGLRLQSDLRFRITDEAVGEWYDRRTLPVGLDRNENLFGGRFNAKYSNVSAHIDLDFVLYGFAQDVEDLQDLSRREKLDPYRFEPHQAYIKVKDLFIDGLDLTVGQQLILWGVADQFNPTNLLNADDVEDILQFGDQQGNFMVRTDYWIDDTWSLTGVLVPIFRPALLPRSGELGLVRTDRQPFVDEALRHRLIAQNAAGGRLALHPSVVSDAETRLPDNSIENMQFAYRIGGKLAGQDISLMYYNGRHDFPVPLSNITTQNDARAGCNPDDSSDCITGVLETDVVLHYPRFYAYGLNIVGELPTDRIAEAISAIGYRVEAALYQPELTRMTIRNGDLDLLGNMVPAGELDYNGNDDGPGERPIIIDDEPFAKWTVGLDYTFNEHVYLNAQWVHGLSNEFGAGDFVNGDTRDVREGTARADDATLIQCAIQQNGERCTREVSRNNISDYVIVTLDLHFLDQALLVRTAAFWDLLGLDVTFFDAAAGERVTRHFSTFTKEGFNAVLYPEVTYNFGNGLDLSVGGVFAVGGEHGRFTDPATGGRIVWTRARFGF